MNNKEFIEILYNHTKLSEKTFQKMFPSVYDDIIKTTNFLSDGKWCDRKYCYKRSITDYPKCVVCGKNCKISRKTCSEECTIIYNKSEECIKAKIDKTKQLHGENCYRSNNDGYKLMKLKDENLYNKFMSETSWMNENTSYQERKFCFDNNITKYPVCAVCGNKVKYIKGAGYPKTCCKECKSEFIKKQISGYSEDKKQEIRQHRIESYRTRSKESIEQSRIKRQETCKLKYNGNGPACSDEVRKKMKQTCKSKTGYENIFQNKEYIKQCTYTKHGVTNIRKNREYIKNCFFKKYGVFSSSHIHLSQYTEESLSDKERFVKMIEDNKCKSVQDIMKVLQVSDYCVYFYLKKYNITNLINRNVSHYEDDIIEWFKTLNIKVIPNYRKIITSKEIDIFLPEYNIGVEFNGSYWHSSLWKKANYHQEKSLAFNAKNIFIYHIFEYEWLQNQEKIKKHLLNLLGLSTNKIFARKCIIKEIDTQVKNLFLEKYHLQGSDKANIKLGLFYNDELVEVMTFCKPRFNKNYQYELSRLCSVEGTNVIGGSSKLFKYFVKTYNPQSIITYSNFAKNRGKVYSLLGFEQKELSKPNYVWVKDTVVLPRYQTQKKNLLKQGFIGTSEQDIMNNRGFFQIFDCGNFVYVWNNNTYK